MSADGSLTGTEINGHVGEILEKYFVNDIRTNGYRKFRNVTLPQRHSDFAERTENFEVRNDDVWVISYPKTGTTWTQEMVWCIANDLDFEGAKEFLPKRFPFFEHASLFDFKEVLVKYPTIELPDFVLDSISYVNNLKSPRFIKTHIPWNLLPKQIRNGEKTPKIIYVCRNVKDTCISYYHHCILLEGYKGSFDDFCELFLNDAVTFSPYWSHVRNFWERKDQPNILFLKYEDMRKDLPSVVRKTADFLGKELNDEQVAQLCDHLSFESMKNNKAVNYEAVIDINRAYNLLTSEGEFMRKGTGGEWKSKMSDEQIQQFNKWIEENKIPGLDLDG